MERLTQKVAEIAADLTHRRRVRRQLTLIAAYTMKDGKHLRPVASVLAVVIPSSRNGKAA